MDALIVAVQAAAPSAPALSPDVLWEFIGASRPTIVASVAIAVLLAVPKAWPRWVYVAVGGMALLSVIGSLVWIVETSAVSTGSVVWYGEVPSEQGGSDPVGYGVPDYPEQWRRLGIQLRTLALPFLLGSAASAWVAYRGWRGRAPEAAAKRPA